MRGEIKKKPLKKDWKKINSGKKNKDQIKNWKQIKLYLYILIRERERKEGEEKKNIPEPNHCVLMHTHGINGKRMVRRF